MKCVRTEVKCAPAPHSPTSGLSNIRKKAHQFNTGVQHVSDVQGVHGLEAPDFGLQFSKDEMAGLRSSDEILQMIGEKSAA